MWPLFLISYNLHLDYSLYFRRKNINPTKMIKKIIILYLLVTIKVCAQISFDSENIVYDKSHVTLDVYCIQSSDLNNDGFKDVIVSSNFGSKLMWFKNVNGNIQYEQRHIISSSVETAKSFVCADTDNDGLNDIIAVDMIPGQILLYKNMGNDTFSEAIIIGETIYPIIVAANDMNNDGNIDVIAVSNNGTALYLTNNGDSTFSNSGEIVFASSSVTKIQLHDINNDGFSDIIASKSDNGVYISKSNTENGFDEPMYAFYTTSEFDIADTNNDNFPDIIYSNDEGIVSRINQNGEVFAEPEVLINFESSLQINKVLISDLDNDSYPDIIAIGNNEIGWFKKNENSYAPYVAVVNNITKPQFTLIENIDNEGFEEIIATFNINNYKTSFFKYNEDLLQYEENIFIINTSAISANRIMDVDNDGLNDIVTGSNYIFWNKNNGDTTFSSIHLISGNTNDPTTYNIEIEDMDNDGLKDIIGIHGSKLEVYKNIGQGKFSLIYFQNLESSPTSLKIADINGDNLPDILLVFYHVQRKLGLVLNQGNFDFSTVTTIDVTSVFYKPSSIRCGDIDNDGDTDIAVCSSEEAAIQWLENDGSGNFALHLIAAEIEADIIELADMNNDGNIDIISGSDNIYDPTVIYWLENNSGSFNNLHVIDYESIQSVAISDFNSDGLIDLVGISYQYYPPYDEKLILYQNNGTTFEKSIIDNVGDVVSLTREVVLGDLNNDNKDDIITSYYYIGKMSCYLNTSILNTTTFNDVTSFKTYPNPFTSTIQWNNIVTNVDIKIYNIVGTCIYQKNNFSGTALQLDNLSKGIYFLQLKANNKIYSQKIIKE
jgi:hypothetical protein